MTPVTQVRRSFGWLADEVLWLIIFELKHCAAVRIVSTFMTVCIIRRERASGCALPSSRSPIR
jgi:hypothetical protein